MVFLKLKLTFILETETCVWLVQFLKNPKDDILDKSNRTVFLFRIFEGLRKDIRDALGDQGEDTFYG